MFWLYIYTGLHGAMVKGDVSSMKTKEKRILIITKPRKAWDKSFMSRCNMFVFI